MNTYSGIKALLEMSAKKQVSSLYAFCTLKAPCIEYLKKCVDADLQYVLEEHSYRESQRNP